MNRSHPTEQSFTCSRIEPSCGIQTLPPPSHGPTHRGTTRTTPGLDSSVREVLLHPFPVLFPADLGPPGARDLHQPLHLVIRQPRLDQFLQSRKKHLLEELAHLVGNLPVERLSGDGRLLLLLA